MRTARVSLASTCIDAGMALMKLMVIGGGTMVTIAEADFVRSAVEVAVIVTTLPAGALKGAS